MPEAVPCGDERYHMAHNYTVVIERRCSGYTSCGLYQHQPHSFDSSEGVRCPGVCDCGMPGYGPHGPGEHK